LDVPPANAPIAKHDDCGGNAYAYLSALKDGDSLAASGFWKPGISPQALFSVHDFHEIGRGTELAPDDKPYKIPRIYVAFEIESSTKGGLPIRKHCDIVMEPTTKNFGKYDCAIVQLSETE
jgi:hypothetical protein